MLGQNSLKKQNKTKAGQTAPSIEFSFEFFSALLLPKTYISQKTGRKKTPSSF